MLAVASELMGKEMVNEYKMNTGCAQQKQNVIHGFAKIT